MEEITIGISGITCKEHNIIQVHMYGGVLFWDIQTSTKFKSMLQILEKEEYL